MADRQVCDGTAISTAHGSLGGGVDVLKDGERWWRWMEEKGNGGKKERK